MALQTEKWNVILNDFNGWETDTDSDDIEDGKSPDLLNVRNAGSHVRGALGYELIGERDTDLGEATSQYTFNRNDGQERMVRVVDDGATSELQWYDEENNKFYTLLPGLEAGAIMGFVEFNTSLISQMVFCNGVDNMSIWSGAITRLTAPVALHDTTINVASTEDFPAATTYEASTIAFVDSGPDTITDSGNGFVTAGFVIGDKIVISGSASNNGVYTVANVAAGTITLDAGDALVAESVGANVTITVNKGTIIYSGVEIAYTKMTATTFTVADAHASVGADDGVAKAADDSTHAAITKGNILLSAKNRLWIAGQPDAPSALDYSDEGDAFTFTGGANRADSGTEDIFNIGGKISGLAEKGEEIIVLGPDGGVGFSFQYPTTNEKVPNYREIFRAPGQGCQSPKSVIKVNSEVYFANKNGIQALADIEGGLKVVNKSITREISPTMEDYDFSEAAGIYFEKENIMMMACKSDPAFPGNDVIVGVDFFNSLDSAGKTVLSLALTKLDWPVNDFAALGNDVYFGSSVEPNSFRGFSTYQNDGAPRSIKYATKRLNLKDPFQEKEGRLIAVKGFIKDGTDIEAKTLFNAGFLGEIDKTIESTGPYVSNAALNTIGAFAQGTNPIGATLAEVSDLKEFLVYLDIGVDYAWNDVQIILESDTDGGTFIITHVGFAVEEVGYASRDDITI